MTKPRTFKRRCVGPTSAALVLSGTAFCLPLHLTFTRFCAGELWPLQSGKLSKPLREDVLFVPQKPYLALGTLRDQIIYPHTREQMQSLGVCDADLGNLLATVDPPRKIESTWKWDDVRDWFVALSGGQKQRVAMVCAVVRLRAMRQAIRTAFRKWAGSWWRSALSG